VYFLDTTTPVYLVQPLGRKFNALNYQLFNGNFFVGNLISSNEGFFCGYLI
jgi:hypothetical protein